MAGSLALSSQPFFQRLETDFRVIAPQLRDVRPETIGVEPVEHLVEFLAENQPDHRHWQLLEPDRFSEDTAENLRGLRIGELTAGDLEFQSHKILGRESARAAKAPMSSVAVVWYGLSARMGP